MKNCNKIHRIYIRVSEDELNLLKTKSTNYPTLSSFVLDACMKYDDELGLQRLERLRLWAQDYKSFEYEISKISNNINQLAHYVNNLQKSGVLLPNIIDEIVRVQSEYNILMSNLLKSNLSYKKLAKKLLR